MRTLAEYAELCQDVMVKGVMETILKESPILNWIPFRELVGNSLIENWELTMPTVAWRSVGEDWTEDTGETVDVAFVLKILGGDVDTDRFAARTRSSINEQHVVDVEAKAKAMAHEWEDSFIYGLASGTKEPNGLHYLASTYGVGDGTYGSSTPQIISMAANSTPLVLTTAKMDDLVELVSGADILLMRTAIKNKLSQYLRTVGSYMTTREQYGKLWPCWGDEQIPLVTSDWLLQTETITAAAGAYSAPTGGTASSIFAIRFGDGDGICGLQGGEMWKRHWKELEAKNAMRTRFGWYVGHMMSGGPDCLARLTGVKNAAVTA